MSQVEDRIREMGLELPIPSKPIANFVTAVRTGNLVFVSGHSPTRGDFTYRGRVGRDLDLETGQEAARYCMLNCLASLKAEIGDLDRVTRVVKLLGMVNSDPEFFDQPKVMNGASDLLTTLFGERGRHARSAVGMVALPGNISVEIEMVVEVD